MDLTKSALSILHALDPVSYLESVSWEHCPKLYAWQHEALGDYDHLLLCCARQAGETVIEALDVAHTARFYPGSLSLVLAPGERQSEKLLRDVKSFIRAEGTYPPTTRYSTTEIELQTGSRILALPGTERTVRGYSAPKRLIFDEASRIETELYRSARPMTVSSDRPRIAGISTPFGKTGWFADAWFKEDYWRKILVVAPFDIVDGRLVDAEPEERFRERMAEEGVSAYYSWMHTPEFCEKELKSIGELWFRQEYLCEFLDTQNTLIPYQYVEQAISDKVQPLFGTDGPRVFSIPPLFQEKVR